MHLLKTTTVLAVMLALLLPAAGYAQNLDQAARQAARQNNAKLLSARTENQDGKTVHVIRLLTSDGVVKTVRVPVRDKQRGRKK